MTHIERSEQEAKFKAHDYVFHKDLVCILHKSLYGLKQAGRMWNQDLTKFLISEGFTQCEIDLCIFTKADMILVIYVDDVVISGGTESLVDAFIAKFRKTSFARMLLTSRRRRKHEKA